MTTVYELGDIILNNTSEIETLQIVLGSGNVATIVTATLAANRTYTLPDVLASANFVMTEGDQTINGTKTFTGAFAMANITLTGTSNQIVIQPGGTGNSITLNATNPASSVVYTYPDVGGAAEFVMTAGTQTIAGNKTFSAALAVSATSNQLVLGTTNTTTISATVPVASATYTIPDVGTSADFVLTAGTQTIGGAKTFSSSVTVTTTSNQLVFGSGNTTTISYTAPAASAVYTVPDVGTASDFVMTAGTQTITGAKTFSSAVTINVASNQLVIQPGINTHTITATDPATSATHTLPSTTGTLVQRTLIRNTFLFIGTITTRKSFYAKLCSFMFNGAANNEDKFTSVNLFVVIDNTKDADYRLQDVTNNNTIASTVSITGTGVEQAVTLGNFTAANIPSGPALFEIQGRKSATNNTNKLRLIGLSLGYA